MNVGCFGFGFKQGGIAIAVRFTNRVTTNREGSSFFVIHRHTGEGFTHLGGGLERVGNAVDTFRVHIDQAHLDSGQRVFHGVRLGDIVITIVRWCQPFFFSPPIGVLFRMPDIFAATGKAKDFQAHGFIGHGASQNDQVGPGELVAVFLFDRPEKTTRFIKVGVIRPGVQRGETKVALAAAATTVGQTV